MIEFTEIESTPESETFAGILALGRRVFGKVDPEKFAKRISEAERLLIVLARNDGEIVGFKIGYKIEPKVFYSWVGGVDKNFRGRGIAGELMKRQHLWCRQNGFKLIRTKTKNEFKPMLILNIRHNFDIVNVYRDKRDELKIVLEKDLLKV
jgi:predicted GNAT superfamily acetyltransferase